MNKKYQLMLTRDELIAVTSATFLTQMLIEKDAEKFEEKHSAHYEALLTAQEKMLNAVTAANADFKKGNAD